MQVINRRYAFTAALALCLMQSGNAWSQQLPWQTGGQQPSPSTAQSPPPTQTHMRKHHDKGNTPAASSAPNVDQRRQDDRHLDDLGVKFQHISVKDKDAVEKLKKLDKEVKAHIATLKQRTYGADDIIKDIRRLESRISAKMKKLEAEASAEPTEPPSAAPAAAPAAPAH